MRQVEALLWVQGYSLKGIENFSAMTKIVPDLIWAPRNLVPEKFVPQKIWALRNLGLMKVEILYLLTDRLGGKEAWRPILFS